MFLRAADLLAGPWRHEVNAATMLGQSKTPHQAEIDSACELIDFLRFNPWYAERIYREQPHPRPGSGTGWIIVRSRGLSTPSRPSTSRRSAATCPPPRPCWGTRCCLEAGRDGGLQQLAVLPGAGGGGSPAGRDQLRAGPLGHGHRSAPGRPPPGGHPLHRFDRGLPALWRKVSEHLEQYAGYPRVVGETGGKDFIVAHPSADAAALAVGMVRGAFEYQGQKCSAASRAYVPQSALARGEGARARHDRRDQHGRRRRFPDLHGRGDRRPGLQAAEELSGPGPAGQRGHASPPAASATTPPGGLSSPRCSKWTIPATGRCARSCSARC